MIDEITIGAVSALLTALLWGLAPVVVRRVVIKDVNPLLFSAIRIPSALTILLIILILTGEFSQMFNISLTDLLIILIASIAGLIFADTMYFTGIKRAGVSVSTPIAFTYPLPALIFAYIILGEEITYALYIGTFLIISGIFLITYQRKSKSSSNHNILKGAIFVIFSTIGWSFGITIIKIALYSTSPLIVSTYRILFALIIFLPYSFAKRNTIKNISRTSLYLVALGGVIGLGLGALTLFISLVYIGAARGSAISASAPLFSAIFASIFLKEKLRKGQIIGMFLTLIGTWVIIFS